MDFKQMFGHKYLVTLEESWNAETPENQAEFGASDNERWYFEIKGRRGTVYPYSETEVAVVLSLRAARRLMKLMGPELVLMRHADDAMSFKADAKHAAALVRFIKPSRLRPLSTEQKATLAFRLARHRFQKPEIVPTNSGGGLAGKRSVRQLVPQVAYPANPPPHQNQDIPAVTQRTHS